MAQQPIPTYQRQEQIQPSSGVPNFGEAAREYGKAAYEPLSQIGAAVAQSANTQMAQQWGYEMGQTPQGDLLPPITNFDKQVTDAYHTQAQATLTLQANQMMYDADTQVNSASRITPGLISQTQQNMAIGMKKIVDNAPTAIKPQLEASFSNQLMSQTHNYQLKMISQNKEDQKNTIVAALNQNAMTANELAAKGDFIGAEHVVDQSKKLAEGGVGSNSITRDQANVSYNTTRQAMLNGKTTHNYLQARAEGKEEKWFKDFANADPKKLGMTFAEKQAAGNAVLSYSGTLDSMRAKDENLRIAQFDRAIVEDVGGINGSMIQDLKENVSPTKFEDAYVKYLTAMKRNNSSQAITNALIAGFNNPEVFARASANDINTAFDENVKRGMQNHTPMAAKNLDEVEAQVAASAAGPVPRYINLLNTKLSSINPTDIESAGKAIEYMYQANKGANLKGVSDESLGMYNMYGALRRVMPADEAAQTAYNAIYNQTPEEKKVVDSNWADFAKSTRQTQGDLNFYTQLGEVDKDKLTDPAGYVEQASSLLESYFKLTKGDLNTAKKMTADAIKSTYGETMVNGKSETTFYPLENVVDLPHDGAGLIQDDIIEQVGSQLKSTKEAFDRGESQYYWEIEPRRTVEGAMAPKHNLMSNFLVYGQQPVADFANRIEAERFGKGEQMTIHRYWKNGTRETYPLIVKADPWLVKLNNQTKPYGGAWDVVIGTERGWKPIQRLNPMMGQFIYYRPNIQKIRSNYAKMHGVGG